jgi:hypothetical protein
MALSASRILLNDEFHTQGAMSVPDGAVPSTSEHVAFWPTRAVGLAVCGIFAWAAALMSCYQVRITDSGELCHRCEAGAFRSWSYDLGTCMQIYLHATNYEDPIIQVCFHGPFRLICVHLKRSRCSENETPCCSAEF